LVNVLLVKVSDPVYVTIEADANEAAPVPPLPTGKVPVTFVPKFTNVVEVVPVPPFAIAKVPASVTAPVVPVLGVRPVVPALNDETPAAATADQEGTPAAKVRTFPLVPAVNFDSVLVAEA
jgi:hypothetical protein